jgi:hypothetical protein
LITALRIVALQVDREGMIAFIKTTLFDERPPAQPELRARAAAVRERRLGRR